LPAASDVAAELATSFNAKSSALLEDAVIEAMVRMGLTVPQAAELVDSRYLAAVRSNLGRLEPQRLPFEISIGKPERLVGKQRTRTTDTPQAARARERLHLVEVLSEVLASINDAEFEHLCASILLRNGASDAVVLIGGNEGGIDFYGRVPVLLGDSGVPRALLRTSLEVRDVLYLGQCKRYSSSSTINRDELQKFAGQVRDCLRQYRGMAVPPSNHVPFDYFSSEEPCIGFFMTSAKFSSGARDYAASVNMVLADGQLLAELLIFWGVGRETTTELTPDSVVGWARSISSDRFFKGP
jgi:restriction endonuclease Mrr